MKTEVIYTYKDANRVWWKLVLTKGEIAENSPFPDDPDYMWKYALLNQDTNEIIFSGEVQGQYTESPFLNQIMGDIQSQVAYLAMGFVEHAKEINT